MTREVTPELLADCLADVKSGRSSIEQCVAAHTRVAEELRQLLEIAQAIPPALPVVPDADFRVRARVALVETITAEKNAAMRSPFRGLLGYMRGWRQPRRGIAMPALIVALVVALTTAGGGAVYASQDALPTDALYQVKVAVEGLQLALALSDEDKAQVYLDHAAKRADEIQKASRAANANAASAAATTFVENVAGAEQHLGRAAASGKDVSRIKARLDENLARQQQALAAAAERAPDAAKLALGKALERAEKGLTVAGGAAGAPVPPATAAGAETNLNKLVSDVEKVAAGSSTSGQSFNGLLSKLDSARAALARGQDRVALNNLNAFLNELNAFERSGRISAQDYDTLFAGYSALVASLGGTPVPGRAPVAPVTATPRAGDDDRGRGQGRDDASATPRTGDDDDRGRGRGRDDASATPRAGDDDRGRGRGGDDASVTPRAGDDRGRNRGPGGPDDSATPRAGDDDRGRNRGPGGPDASATPRAGDDDRGRGRGRGGDDAQATPGAGDDDRGRGRGRDDAPTPPAAPPAPPTVGPAAPPTPAAGDDDRGRGRGPGGPDATPGPGDDDRGRGRGRDDPPTPPAVPTVPPPPTVGPSVPPPPTPPPPGAGGDDRGRGRGGDDGGRGRNGR